MSAVLKLRPLEEDSEVVTTTLWDLVWAVSESAGDEAEVLATVGHMLRSGRVRLGGTFRDDPPEVA